MASISSAGASLPSDGGVAGVACGLGMSTTMFGSRRRAGICVWRFGRLGGGCSCAGSGAVEAVDEVENRLSVARLATSAYPSPP